MAASQPIAWHSGGKFHENKFHEKFISWKGKFHEKIRFHEMENSMKKLFHDRKFLEWLFQYLNFPWLNISWQLQIEQIKIKTNRIGHAIQAWAPPQNARSFQMSIHIPFLS